MDEDAKSCCAHNACCRMDDDERLERRVYLNSLYDFYSPLLTDRQRSVYEMLYFSDMTLTEAAKSLGVSRQAVHILEKRVTDRLENIEAELSFARLTAGLEAKISCLETRVTELEAEIKALKDKH